MNEHERWELGQQTIKDVYAVDFVAAPEARVHGELLLHQQCEEGNYPDQPTFGVRFRKSLTLLQLTPTDHEIRLQTG